GMKSIEFTSDELKRFDAVLICTDHDNVDHDCIVENGHLVVDTRNATKEVKHHRERTAKASEKDNTVSPKSSELACGYWGKNHVRNFAELGALHSVCDPNIQIAEKFAQEYGVPALSFEDVLKDSSCDGIVIATPATLHASLAQKALEAGKHVFVEKPL